VIVNDWGILRRLRAERPDLVPVAGFLLMREPRDPRATDDAGCPPLGRSAPDFRLSVPYLDLLRRHGLRRIEISAPHRGFTVAPLPPDFRLTLHAPYSFLAATRQCPWRAALARASLGTAGCPQPCRRRAARLNDPSHPHASFMLRWNAWYTLPPAADLAAIGADRLVLQVRPDGEACP
jgi:hypothetical protein